VLAVKFVSITVFVFEGLDDVKTISQLPTRGKTVGNGGDEGEVDFGLPQPTIDNRAINVKIYFIGLVLILQRLVGGALCSIAQLGYYST
jgi:hypothetical protein